MVRGGRVHCSAFPGGRVAVWPWVEQVVTAWILGAVDMGVGMGLWKMTMDTELMDYPYAKWTLKSDKFTPIKATNLTNK